ncbi:MAG: hypothetical protein KatS3mg060_2874 [Dehalococcoidia bacterium]|nr:MAG: hypothetical protein KatS3mg060_2874 [Dehalococcoidia bacterium]
MNRILSSLALVAALALVACGAPRASTPTRDLPSCEGVPAQSDSSAPHETWVAAFDRTTSYPPGVREAGQRELADFVDGLVRPGAGATVHILLIARNSYNPANSLPTIVVPPVMPVKSPGAPPTPPKNKFDQREKKRYDEALASWCSAQRADAARLERDLAAAAEQVRARTDALRSYRVPHEAGSDFGSVVLRAAERFANAPAGSRRVLLWYSDMEPYAGQGRALDNLPPLTGVEVIVSHWHCASPAICQLLRGAWEERLAAAGAASLRWYAVGEPVPTEVLLGERSSPASRSAGHR